MTTTTHLRNAADRLGPILPEHGDGLRRLACDLEIDGAGTLRPLTSRGAQIVRRLASIEAS